MKRNASRLYVIVAASAVVTTLLVVSALAVRQQYVAEARLRLHPGHEQVFREQNKAVTATELPRIVVFGDSRVARWRPRPAMQPAQWLWRGVAGETTAQMLLRYQADVLDLRPDIVIILGGINDLTCGVAVRRPREAIASATANISRMISLAAAAGIRVIVLNVVRPARPWPWRWIVWSPSFPDFVDHINAQLRSLAAPGVRILEADALLAHDARYLSSRFAVDTVHFTAAAYEVLNASVVTEVEAVINAVQ